MKKIIKNLIIEHDLENHSEEFEKLYRSKANTNGKITKEALDEIIQKFKDDSESDFSEGDKYDKKKALVESESINTNNFFILEGD